MSQSFRYWRFYKFFFRPGPDLYLFALGYLFFGALSLLNSADILKIPETCFSELLQTIRKTAADNDPQNDFNENPGRRLAAALKGTIPVIYSAAFLSGRVRAAVRCPP